MRVDLSCLPIGRSAQVTCISDCAFSLRLRELGLYEGQQLKMLCVGDPMICRVGQTARIAICRKLARKIEVSQEDKALPVKQWKHTAATL